VPPTLRLDMASSAADPAGATHRATRKRRFVCVW
jgi:hypothetical protein